MIAVAAAAKTTTTEKDTLTDCLVWNGPFGNNQKNAWYSIIAHV